MKQTLNELRRMLVLLWIVVFRVHIIRELSHWDFWLFFSDHFFPSSKTTFWILGYSCGLKLINLCLTMSFSLESLIKFFILLNKSVSREVHWKKIRERSFISGGRGLAGKFWDTFQFLLGANLEGGGKNYWPHSKGGLTNFWALLLAWVMLSK